MTSKNPLKSQKNKVLLTSTILKLFLAPLEVQMINKLISHQPKWTQIQKMMQSMKKILLSLAFVLTNQLTISLSLSTNQFVQHLQMVAVLMESKEKIAQIDILSSAENSCKVAEQKMDARTGTVSFFIQESARVLIFLGPVLRKVVKKDTLRILSLNQTSPNLQTHSLSQLRIPRIKIDIFFYAKEKYRKGWNT